MAARHSRLVPGVGQRGAAEKRSGTSGGIHIKYVGEAAAVFRLCGSGTVQQPGGKLDASGSAGQKKLAARGQRPVRSEGGGDSFGRGILPTARGAGEGISRRSVARIEPAHDL